MKNELKEIIENLKKAKTNSDIEKIYEDFTGVFPYDIIKSGASTEKELTIKTVENELYEMADSDFDSEDINIVVDNIRFIICA